MVTSGSGDAGCSSLALIRSEQASDRLAVCDLEGQEVSAVRSKHQRGARERAAKQEGRKLKGTGKTGCTVLRATAALLLLLLR